MKNGKEILKEYLQYIPEKPGVYKYFNEKGEIIYVGKAVNLHKRVSNYLEDEKTTQKTKNLVKNIRKVEFTIVDSEQDAFLLENNLIKKHQPFYNILLKDGKSYPKILITSELYPRVFPIRDIKRYKGEIYGPYSSLKSVEFIIETINHLYPIRTCKNDFSKQKHLKVCLKYHLGKCCGICEHKVSDTEYNDWIKQIRKLIRGDVQNLINELKEEMRNASDKLNYEKAASIKNKLQILLNYKSKSIVTNTKINDVDVYAYKENKNEVYITVLHINNGSITQTKTLEYKTNLEESKEYILSMAINDTRNILKSTSKTVIVPFQPEFTADLNCRQPKNSVERELLALANKNVEEYYNERIKQNDRLNPKERYVRILKKLATITELKKTPITIDSFDVSHLQGSNAVGSCVRFKMGQPSKSDYQKFIIKNNFGNDDFKNTQEIVKRRLDSILDKDMFPDLIIADGGEIQMRAIREIVEDFFGLSIPVIGLKKDKHHITNKLLCGEPIKEVDIPITDEVFHLLSKIQNEVHRFAINFHKKRRTTLQKRNRLETIKGIGPKTREKLILKFKSIEAVKSESIEALTEIIGKEKASIIYNEFHNGDL